jgi:LDH2 family malate/lactate/ureidoglycolate dehydrogenase
LSSNVWWEDGTRARLDMAIAVTAYCKVETKTQRGETMPRTEGIDRPHQRRL